MYAIALESLSIIESYCYKQIYYLAITLSL